MPAINQHLAHHGICHLDAPYSREEIARINQVVEPLFAARSNLPRAYVHSDEIAQHGLLDIVLNPRMCSYLFSIMPDAVLYHLHIYEIAAHQEQPHVFGETMAGWHRDFDSENPRNGASHVSLFTYLSDVGEEDGPFQFIPQHPLIYLHSGTRYASMVGASGSSFAWNRSFYHRASPNRGPVRRRLLKISIQPRHLLNEWHDSSHFERLSAAVPPGDIALDQLLARSPTLQHITEQPLFHAVTPQHRLALKNSYLLQWQARLVARAIKRRLKKPAPMKLYD